MFVGRRIDGSIFGAWTVRQFEGQEELPDNAPELVSFLIPKPPLDQADFDNAMRIIKAKCVSDLAFRLGKAPGALTAAEIQAERTRIKNISDALP